MQVFGCVGHVQPALWPRGCYCKHDWPQVDVLGCQIYRFLALLYRCSRSDTSAPPGDTPHPTSYTLGWHLLPAVVLSAPAVGSHLFNFPGTTAPSHWRECEHTRNWPHVPLSQAGFLREAILFFKSVCWPISKGPVLLYLYDTAGGPKSK